MPKALTIRLKRDIVINRKEAVRLKISLKAARVNTGMTQYQAAERVGVTRATLQNWELGRSYPNALQIKAIEDAYNVRYDDIIFLPSITLKA